MLKSELEAENNKLKNQVKKLQRDIDKLELQLSEAMYDAQQPSLLQKVKKMFS